MGIATMGKVLVSARIENLKDLYQANDGQVAPEAVRSVTVEDALVDKGATGLLMPKRLIAQLGLDKFRVRSDKTAGGTVSLNVYSTVRLTIQGRECHCDVTEINDDLPVLIGQVPLELMDRVVDPRGQKLIGNPAHGGEFMQDAFVRS